MRLSSPAAWNRNTHYHDRLLAAIPAGCSRVLDVGCGTGSFARRLAHVAEHVDGIDRDREALANARRVSHDLPNVHFIEADFLSWQAETTYDAVSMIAVLHHLPFHAALRKARTLLRARGVLIVLGLDRSPSLPHLVATGAVATLADLWHNGIRPTAKLGAPIKEPEMTLREVRDEAAQLLPGALIRRHALLRYSLIWRIE